MGYFYVTPKPVSCLSRGQAQVRASRLVTSTKIGAPEPYTTEFHRLLYDLVNEWRQSGIPGQTLPSMRSRFAPTLCAPRLTDPVYASRPPPARCSLGRARTLPYGHRGLLVTNVGLAPAAAGAPTVTAVETLRPWTGLKCPSPLTS